MPKREKRIKRGILSLEDQKKLHEAKRNIARELGQEELVRYYDKEIESIEKRKDNRESKLTRKK